MKRAISERSLDKVCMRLYGKRYSDLDKETQRNIQCAAKIAVGIGLGLALGYKIKRCVIEGKRKKWSQKKKR